MNLIVVIEDHPATLRGLSATLRSRSHHVLTADHGEHGIHRMAEQQRDRVIFELMPPKMSVTTKKMEKEEWI